MQITRHVGIIFVYCLHLHIRCSFHLEIQKFVQNSCRADMQNTGQTSACALIQIKEYLYRKVACVSANEQGAENFKPRLITSFAKCKQSLLWIISFAAIN